MEMSTMTAWTRLPSFSTLEPTEPPYNHTTAYCTAYCDIDGYYNKGFWCPPQDDFRPVYCCG